MRSQEEFRLACFVADTLRRFAHPDVLWSHFPAGEHRNPITGARLKRMGTKTGWSDYILISPGPKVRWLELKSKKGRPTAEQMAFRIAVIALGCDYAMVRSGDEAITILKRWGILTSVRVAA